MSSNIFEGLLTGQQSNNISGELLETLGKQAAARHLKDGSNLNEAIGGMISEHPGINNEHTKRIAEFANNHVFQEMHSKSDDKNVHFDVADPGVIIRDMKDGGSPAHTGKTLHNGQGSAKASSGDYAQGPEMGSAFGPLDSAFQAPGQEDGEHVKTAGAFVNPAGVDHSLHSNPVDDVYDTHIRLQASKEKLASAHETFDLLYKAAEEDYFKAAKHEVLSHGGAGMSGVIQATKLAAPSDSVAFKLLEKVATRLISEGVPQDELLKTGSDNRLLNPDHPLPQSIVGLIKAAEEISKSQIALGEIDSGLQKTAAFIKSL